MTEVLTDSMLALAQIPNPESAPLMIERDQSLYDCSGPATESRIFKSLVVSIILASEFGRLRKPRSFKSVLHLVVKMGDNTPKITGNS